MQQNVWSLLFGEAHTHGFRRGSVLVRLGRIQRNIHSRTRQRTSTPVYEREGGSVAPFLLFRCNDNIERLVEPPLRGAQPFDLYADRTPSLLDNLAVPFTDRSQVERAAVPEVQARPQSHRGSIA
jgi:hypothetical protein